MKSFVYLDRHKMYSLSSQLMEGVTEYILEEKQDKVVDEERQKGPVASGRIIAEIIEKTSGSVEKKFLHDYAYSLFESRLREEQKLVELGERFTFEDVLGAVRHGQLVRVKGKAKFVDYLEMAHSLKAAGIVMPALGILTTNDERVSLAEKLPNLRGQDKSAAQARFKSLNDPKNFAQEEHEKFFHKHLSELLEYAFGDALELAFDFDQFKVTADLSRDWLQGSVNSIVRKYSRFSEVEFCMLGVVTQVGDLGPDPASEDVIGDHSLREALSMATAALATMENSFRRRSTDEIILDPIAVYVEL